MTKVCLSIDIQGLITYAAFGYDRLRGLGVAIDRISRITIDFSRRPYNPLALPCKLQVCDVFFLVRLLTGSAVCATLRKTYASSLQGRKMDERCGGIVRSSSLVLP